MSESVLIVDGYNVLHASERYETLAARDVDAARALLVRDVELVCEPGQRAMVVFDGGANPASDGTEHSIGEVAVVFSAYGHDADEVIEAAVASHRADGNDVTVVTSDAETQWVALGHGARRTSSAAFVARVAQDTQELREHNPAGSDKLALEDRIDRTTRETLARWARGER